MKNHLEELFFDKCTASVVQKSVKFAGQVWRPTRMLAYVVTELCHSLPVLSVKRRGFTAATLANSFPTLQNNLVNFEHRLKYYGAKEDKICGAIAAVEFPSKEDAIAAEAKGESVSLKALIALSRKIENVDEVLHEIASANNPWRTSMECEGNLEDYCIFSDGKYYELKGFPDAIMEKVKANTIDDIDGKPAYMLLGGKDGNVIFSGTALTEYPADKQSKITSVVASRKLILNCGWHSQEDWQEAASMDLKLESSETAAAAWDTKDAPDKLFAYVPAEAKGPNGNKSARKFPLASKEKKGLDPAILRNALARLPQASLSTAEKASTKRRIMAAIRAWNSAHPKEAINVSEKSGIGFDIGYTDVVENHGHSVTDELFIKPTRGHIHFVDNFKYNKAKGQLVGTTTGPVGSNDVTDEEGHVHKFTLGMADEAASAAKVKEEGNVKDLIKVLQEVASQLAEANPKLAASVSAEITKLEKQTATESVDKAVNEVIDARIASGDLVSKANHEKAVASAKEETKKALEKEAADKAAAEKASADKLVERTKKLEEAGIDPKFVIAKDRTIASEVSSMPADENGDKVFTARLEEWVAWTKKTGQAKASTDTKETASETVPVGGTNNGGEKKAVCFA